MASVVCNLKEDIYRDCGRRDQNGNSVFPGVSCRADPNLVYYISHYKAGLEEARNFNKYYSSAENRDT